QHRSDALKKTLAEKELTIAELTQAHEAHQLTLQQNLTDLQSRLNAAESALTDEQHRSDALKKTLAEKELTIAELTQAHAELQLWYNDLQLRAQRSRELLEHSSSLVLLLDADALITAALSSAAERLLGYSPSELVGRSVFEFVFAQDRAIAEAFFAQQVATSDAIAPVRVRMVHKAGQPIHVEIASHNLLRNESVGAILLNVSDATAYEQLEQQLHKAKDDFDARLTERTHELSELSQKLQAETQARAHLEVALQQSQDDLWKLFRLSPLATVLCRADNGYTLNVNPAFTTLSGIACEDALGKPIDALGIRLSAEQLSAVVSSQPETDTPKCLNFEADFHTKSGEVKNVALTLQPIQLAQARCVLIFVQDLTAHKQAEKLLEQVLTEKASALEDIYHQVKNDLQVVSSLLYLQSLKLHDAQARELFRESQNRVKSLALIYEQLCQTPTSSKVNFAEYLHDLVSVLAESYSTSAMLEVQPSNARLELSLDSAVPAGLIVTELVTNSLKYAFPESWHSADTLQKISIYTHQSSDGEITLTVRDNGIGLDSHQSLEAPKTLGLRLVKMLTEQLHGKLEALSEAGTIFHIRFRDDSQV
ncbi:MAG: PAS domain S-box protein, partial [Candidatus Thermochlorobacter sp.]